MIWTTEAELSIWLDNNNLYVLLYCLKTEHGSFNWQFQTGMWNPAYKSPPLSAVIDFIVIKSTLNYEFGYFNGGVSWSLFLKFMWIYAHGKFLELNPWTDTEVLFFSRSVQLIQQVSPHPLQKAWKKDFGGLSYLPVRLGKWN